MSLNLTNIFLGRAGSSNIGRNNENKQDKLIQPIDTSAFSILSGNTQLYGLNSGNGINIVADDNNKTYTFDADVSKTLFETLRTDIYPTISLIDQPDVSIVASTDNLEFLKDVNIKNATMSFFDSSNTLKTEISGDINRLRGDTSISGDMEISNGDISIELTNAKNITVFKRSGPFTTNYIKVNDDTNDNDAQIHINTNRVKIQNLEVNNSLTGLATNGFLSLFSSAVFDFFGDKTTNTGEQLTLTKNYNNDDHRLSWTTPHPKGQNAYGWLIIPQTGTVMFQVQQVSETGTTYIDFRMPAFISGNVDFTYRGFTVYIFN